MPIKKFGPWGVRSRHPSYQPKQTVCFNCTSVRRTRGPIARRRGGNHSPRAPYSPLKKSFHAFRRRSVISCIQLRSLFRWCHRWVMRCSNCCKRTVMRSAIMGGAGARPRRAQGRLLARTHAGPHFGFAASYYRATFRNHGGLSESERRPRAIIKHSTVPQF